MRLVYSSCLLMLGLTIAGCDDNSAPTTVEASWAEQYVAGNPKAVAFQGRLDAEAEAMAEADV